MAKRVTREDVMSLEPDKKAVKTRGWPRRWSELRHNRSVIGCPGLTASCNLAWIGKRGFDLQFQVHCLGCLVGLRVCRVHGLGFVGSWAYAV